MKIFFAGPLTDLKNPEITKSLYKDMAAVANTLGIDSFWAFLNGTDPIKNPEVPAVDVYTADLGQLKKSDVMIIYLGEPTTGTGQEIEYARTQGIPVYMLYEQGKNITRMVKGSPNIKGSIEFTSSEDAIKKLEDLLQGLKKRFEQQGTLKEDFSIVGDND